MFAFSFLSVVQMMIRSMETGNRMLAGNEENIMKEHRVLHLHPRSKKFLTAVLLLLCAVFTLYGAERLVRRCTECGKTIPSNVNYLTNGEMSFCNENCYNKYVEKLLPVCCVCGKHFKNGYTSDGKNYCSKQCLESKFPVCVYCKKHKPDGFLLDDLFLCASCSELPKCDSCFFPAGNRYTRLEDGRKICAECTKIGIFEQDKAASVMMDIRNELLKDFRMSTDHTIKFDLCMQNDIATETGTDGQRERGLYVFTTKDTGLTLFGKPIKLGKDQFRILILTGLPEPVFRSVAAHELAHDWMGAELPHITDRKVQEGFAEFISWAYSSKRDYKKVVYVLENNRDPVYGDGFREVRDLLKNVKQDAASWKAALLKKYPVPKKK